MTTSEKKKEKRTCSEHKLQQTAQAFNNNNKLYNI